jgi:hypothetical protein
VGLVGNGVENARLQPDRGFDLLGHGRFVAIELGRIDDFGDSRSPGNQAILKAGGQTNGRLSNLPRIDLRPDVASVSSSAS